MTMANWSCTARPASSAGQGQGTVNVPRQELREQPVAPVRAEEPPLDSRFEALLAERDRLRDWRNTAFVQPQPFIKGQRPLRKSGAFPFKNITSARGFTFARMRSLEGRCGYQVDGKAAVTPDDAQPFAPDGSLCPNVVVPAAELSSEQLQKVLALVMDAERDYEARDRKGGFRPLLRCGFEPHHAVVFYDSKGAPVAKLVVCFTCGEVLAVPSMAALGGGNPAALSRPGEFETLHQLFEELGLGVWIYDEATVDEVRAYVDRVYGPPEKRTKRGQEADALKAAKRSGVEPSRLVSSLTDAERSRMCIWFQEAAFENRRAREWVFLGGRFECDDQRGWSFAASPDPSECASVAKTCSFSVQQVEDCMRAFLNLDAETICASGPPQHCAGMMDCLPGIRWRPAK
jgi:hypothetical protein